MEMASPINPNDPFSPLVGDQDPNRRVRFEDEIQGDPELAEGRAGGGRVALFAVAIAVVLGAVFYGLSNGAMTPDGTKSATAPITQDSAQIKSPGPTNNIADSKPPVAPGVRDVTPGNSAPGITTGAAPSRPQSPEAAPMGTGVDRSNKRDAN
jgi:hypothetical protein